MKVLEGLQTGLDRWLLSVKHYCVENAGYLDYSLEWNTVLSPCLAPDQNIIGIHLANVGLLNNFQPVQSNTVHRYSHLLLMLF